MYEKQEIPAKEREYHHADIHTSCYCADGGMSDVGDQAGCGKRKNQRLALCTFLLTIMRQVGAHSCFSTFKEAEATCPSNKVG